MSSVVFDAEEGVLRLSHPALSVLARLAADPSDPALRDHAVAEPLAALRGAGVLGRGGIHPDVAPLAQAVGTARLTLELTVTEADASRAHHGWVTPQLAVFAVPAGRAFDLVADRPEAVADLVGDLVGLDLASAGSDAEALVVGGAEFHRLMDALHRQWRLSVHDGEHARHLEVYDAGSAGLWLLDDTEGEASTLRPTTGPDVRRRVHELAGPQAFA